MTATGRFQVTAHFPGGTVGAVEIEHGELVRARHALAYLKHKLGNDAMLDLIADDLKATTATVQQWVRESAGSWQSDSLELIVSGPPADAFHDWYVDMFSRPREAIMRSGHPEHFVSHPQSQHVEVAENVGETELPWHIFYCPLSDDDPGLPAGWDPEFPVHFGAEIIDSDGIRVGFTMHQSRDGADGMHLKLTTHLPAAAPRELVRRHLQHFAIEFTNWTHTARAELANDPSL